MKQLKCYTMAGAIFVLITGTLSHFAYDWSGGNFIAGLFTPINESVWEHMKLVFFPMLLYTVFVLFKFKKACPCITSSFCFGILTGTIFIPILFYAYTFILGKNIFFIDISIFIFCVAAAFWISCRLTISCRLKPYTALLCSIVCILFLCFLAFTYYPPKLQIFEDPEALQTSGQYRTISLKFPPY